MNIASRDTVAQNRPIALLAPGVLAYAYYERTRPVAKIDLPGVSGEITREGVNIEVGKPKN
jgi:hypothetical protein